MTIPDIVARDMRRRALIGLEQAEKDGDEHDVFFWQGVLSVLDNPDYPIGNDRAAPQSANPGTR